jgi:hypothetical protein
MSDINDDTMNSTLYDELGNAVTVVLGTKNKLAVDATISGDESPTLYQDRVHKDIPGQVVTTAADVVLYTFTGAPGLVDFIAVSSGNQNYEVALKVDGIERWRFTMADLNAVGLSNATNVPVWAENANKNFRYRPFSGSGFSTSFEIIGRATVGTQTLAHVVIYREKV